jgi:peptidoglycan hydrolase-like protein with peptidoglycan-binding domain
VNRRIAIPVTAVALAAAGGGAAWALAGQGSASGTETNDRPNATATVDRRNLVQYESVDGTLGYDDSRTLYAQGAGTVTALRRPGRVVTRGGPLYWVDSKPVTLLYGSVPMWRPLNASSSDGADIRELEQNLVALGYDPYGGVEVDDEWDSATTAAVKRWQGDLGLAKTGAVAPGDVAFLPGPRRIGQLKATVGALLQPGAEVMDTTSTKRVVTIDLDADKQSLVKQGDRVAVDLPDGSTIHGRIASVGKVAQSTQDPNTGEQGTPTIEVRVTLPRGAKTGAYDEAPVGVSLAKETARNVLTVPVEALLALAEGGYAVEVVNADGSTRLVRVEPGLYADSFVELTGSRLKQGTKVVVPE